MFKVVSSSVLVLVAAALAMLAGACSHLPGKPNSGRSALASWVPSPNHNERGPMIVVIHATEQSSAEASLHTLRTANAQGPVSAHYLVGKDGHIYQLVSEKRRAWHAGGGSWGTITDLNSASIGIELDNDGRSEFPAVQIEALLRLLDDVCTRRQIRRTQVIAHADLAPRRKTDPGARFPWRRLAQAGFGRWPAPERLAQPVPEGFDGWLALRLLGYRIDDPQAALRAFRLHFRGIDDAASPMGDADRRILHALASP